MVHFLPVSFSQALFTSTTEAPLTHAAIDPHPLVILPFATLLLCIALCPLFCHHWWENHYGKVAVGLGSLTIAYYLLTFGDAAAFRISHAMDEYISFIALIGSLYIVAGGIHITVKGEATPLVNVIFLACGALLANLIGTTGASMVLIRPWLRMNKFRYTHFHTVFFIFVVSNCGGCLTPVGDPPLFLGYLKHIPFFWQIEHLWMAWLLCNGLIIGVFYIFDALNFRRVPQDVATQQTAEEHWKFEGWINVFFLAVILAAIFIPMGGMSVGLREVMMLAAAAGSYELTPRRIHETNGFSFGPVKEVAWLFVGIFATMMPALDYLQAHASQFGIDTPLEFYFFTGVLSSGLDNAPTYLTFLTTAVSQSVGGDGHHLNINSPADMGWFVGSHDLELTAISLGAVFFGAMSYIGNGPNLMVKAIVIENGQKAPHFLEYIYKYSLPILAPILILVGLLFLWG